MKESLCEFCKYAGEEWFSRYSPRGAFRSCLWQPRRLAKVPAAFEGWQPRAPVNNSLDEEEVARITKFGCPTFKAKT